MPMKRTLALTRILGKVGIWQITVVLLAVALTWGFLLTDLRQEYRDEVEGAQRETTALARGLGETTLMSFDTIDQTLKDMREAYSRDPDHFDLRAWFDGHQFGTGLIIQATIVGPDGIVIQSNLPLAARTDLSDRDHIRVQKNSITDEMFISQPVLGRVSKRKSLNVTRKIIGPDGRYEGTVVVSAGLDYLTRFLESLSARGVIELIGVTDGVIRSMAPVDIDLIGSSEHDFGRMVRIGSGTIRTDAYDG